MVPIAPADNITGEVQPLPPLVDELEARFPGEIVSLASAWPRWPMEAWSNTFVLHRRSGRPWFLKGTPRQRREAALTEELYRLVPAHLPHTILSDLLPGSRWHWFITEHAGEPVVDGELEFTEQGSVADAVRALALIQRQARASQRIAQLLPPCEPESLQQLILDICLWYASRRGARRQEYEDTARTIGRDTTYFRQHATALSARPCTIVHGDFWAGNVVREAGSVRILDWGDVVWGPGGLSITGLLGQHRRSLAAREAEIWSVYAEALGEPLDQPYVQSCARAYDLADIVIHHQIHLCCDAGPDVDEAAWRLFDRLATAINQAQ
jgi:hypothetical protein